MTIGPASGDRLIISQSSAAGIIAWEGFSIGAGAAVHFANGAGATLNRVAGDVPSAIDGRLTATGSVYLVNPAGIAIGSDGQVSTGGSFFAATHDVDDESFLAGGVLTFQGASDGAVVNRGRIESAGGDVALIARSVENAGAIAAPAGTAALAAGYEVLARPADHGDGKFAVRVGGADTAATTTGAIRAASAEIRAHGGNVYALAGNTAGIVSATGVAAEDGRIFLTAPGGAVAVDGTVAATAADGAGGLVVVTGTRVDIGATGHLDASGSRGGTVLVGGDWRGGRDAATRLLPETAVATAQTTTVAAGARIAADGENGDGGIVAVWSDGTTSTHGRLSARGATGGRIETSGRHVDVGGAIDAGPGGLWLLDPNDLAIDAPLAATIAATLGGGADVTQQTTLAGVGGSGDITVAAPITWGTDATLTLEAYRNVAVAAAITSTGGGGVTLRADSEGTGDGTVSFNGAGAISTAGAVEILYNPTSYATPTDFSGDVVGGGSLTAYMLVNDVNQLQAMASGPAGRYALGRDIDASATIGWNAGAGFAPIGDDLLAFTGIFDGRDHTIDRLFIYRPGTDYVGLFGYAENAVIRNVSLTDATVTGADFVGSLVGWNVAQGGAASIDRASVTGAVSGKWWVGGLIGGNQADAGTALIRASAAAGTVSGWFDVGGLVGFNSATDGTASVADSQAGAEVDGQMTVGGLIGSNTAGLGGTASVTASRATGSVSGGYFVGGLVGSSTATDGGMASIAASSASGDVVAGDFVGGLVGSNAAETGGTAAITASHAAGAVDGVDFVGGLTGENNAIGATALITASYATGAAFGEWYVGGLTGSNAAKDGGIASIATSYATGTADGLDYVGGLVGENNAFNATASVATSYATGAVFGEWCVGGLVGWNDAEDGGTAAITTSYAAGAVDGLDSVGGLVGGNDGADGTASIRHAHATGAVTGITAVGGLVGDNAAGDGTASIRHAYATGAVTGDEFVGGLVGWNGADGGGGGTASIDGTYAAGTVTGNASVGGLVGKNKVFAGAASVANSYWDSSTSGLTQGIGLNEGGTMTALGGRTTTEFHDTTAFIALATTAGWDFEAVWAPSDAGHYPQLYATSPVAHVATGSVSRIYGSANPGSLNTRMYGGPALYAFGAAGDALGVPAIDAPPAITADVGSYAFTGPANATSLLGRVYRIVYSGEFAITPVTLSAALTGAVARVYNGDANATLTAANYAFDDSNVLFGDDVTLDWKAAGTYDTRHVGEDKPVSVSGLKLGGAKGGNYVLDATSLSATIGEITKADLTVGVAAVAKRYGDSYDFDGSEVTAAGLFAPDVVDGATMSSPGAAANATVAGGPYAIAVSAATGTGLSNYTITYADGWLTVAPRPLTVTMTAADKIYDGSDVATAAVVTDALAGDLVTLDHGQARFADRHAGAAKTVTLAGLALGGADAGNYSLGAAVATATAAIAPRPLTIAAAADARVYDGTTASASAPTHGPLVAGDAITGLVQEFDAKHAGARMLAVTGYAIDDGNGGANYAVLTLTAPGDIASRPVTVTIDHMTKGLGEPDPAFGWHVTDGGVVAGDGWFGLPARAAGEAVGVYGIVAGSLNAGADYALDIVPGSLTILDPGTGRDRHERVHQAEAAPRWRSGDEGGACEIGVPGPACRRTAHPANRGVGRWLSMSAR